MVYSNNWKYEDTWDWDERPKPLKPVSISPSPFLRTLRKCSRC